MNLPKTIKTLAGNIENKQVGRLMSYNIRNFIEQALTGDSHGTKPVKGITHKNCLSYWGPMMGSMNGLTTAEQDFIVASLKSINFNS